MMTMEKVQYEENKERINIKIIKNYRPLITDTV